jgi:hypothetical protein
MLNGAGRVRYHGCVTSSERDFLLARTASPAYVATLHSLEAMRVAMEALPKDRKLRDGLRFISGIRTVFMPEPPTVDRLVKLGLVEVYVHGVSVGMADNYRPTGLGSDLLPAIGVRG